jgi:hypothetical protein
VIKSWANRSTQRFAELAPKIAAEITPAAG